MVRVRVESGGEVGNGFWIRNSVGFRDGMGKVKVGIRIGGVDGSGFGLGKDRFRVKVRGSLGIRVGMRGGVGPRLGTGDFRVGVEVRGGHWWRGFRWIPDWSHFSRWWW